jgi:AraC family transcriptional regulator
MNPQIQILPEKKLIGKRISMSMTNNKTFELWRSFMPKRKEISHTIGTDLFSMQVYDKSFDFKSFNPNTVFDKWAAIEVSDFENVPNEMETFTLTGGLYAVFVHKGSNTDFSTFQYIFAEWLPNHADYVLDNRPHFEILGAKYINGSPDSEEDIWIPIQIKHPL